MAARSDAALKLVPGLKRGSDIAQPAAETTSPDVLVKDAYRDLVEARRLTLAATTRLGYAGQTRMQADAGRAYRQLTDAVASFHDERA